MQPAADQEESERFQEERAAAEAAHAAACRNAASVSAAAQVPGLITCLSDKDGVQDCTLVQSAVSIVT